MVSLLKRLFKTKHDFAGLTLYIVDKQLINVDLVILKGLK